MSEDQNTQLVQLKEEADRLNLDYHPSIGLQQLQKRVDAAKEANLNAGKHKLVAANKNTTEKVDPAHVLTLVKVTPTDSSLTKHGNGIDIRIANRQIRARHAFPFNTPYHLPAYAIERLEATKTKTMVLNPEFPAANEPQYIPKNIPAFNITKLPPLTEKELAAIDTNIQLKKLNRK